MNKNNLILSSKSKVILFVTMANCVLGMVIILSTCTPQEIGKGNEQILEKNKYNLPKISVVSGLDSTVFISECDSLTRVIHYRKKSFSGTYLLWKSYHKKLNPILNNPYYKVGGNLVFHDTLNLYGSIVPNTIFPWMIENRFEEYANGRNIVGLEDGCVPYCIVEFDMKGVPSDIVPRQSGAIYKNGQTLLTENIRLYFSDKKLKRAEMTYESGFLMEIHEYEHQNGLLNRFRWMQLSFVEKHFNFNEWTVHYHPRFE